MRGCRLEGMLVKVRGYRSEGGDTGQREGIAVRMRRYRWEKGDADQN